MKEFEQLVNGLAAKYCADGLELADLKQEALLSILENLPLYNESMGVSVQTFLGRKIRNSLSKFRATSLDLVEVSREWVAESIADGPSAALRAKTKAGCELLCAVVGPDLFKKPKRESKSVKLISSLDDSSLYSDADGDEGSLHETIGTAPPQYAMIEANRRLASIKDVSDNASSAGKHGASEYWEKIVALRAEGRTFSEIGRQLGKSAMAVQMAWRRAQKRLAKRAA